MKLLILDNYDSFTYNLVHLVEKVCDIPVYVKRNNEIGIGEVDAYEKIILSPGPGLPSEAGIMPELLRRYHGSKSILGVCLGLQAMAECFNSPLSNLQTVFHGLATPVEVIADDLLFRDCPRKFKVGRYHSWVVDRERINSSFTVTAIDENQLVMAARHNSFDLRGVQFHPESILSEHGETIMRNWVLSG